MIKVRGIITYNVQAEIDLEVSQKRLNSLSFMEVSELVQEKIGEVNVNGQRAIITDIYVNQIIEN